MYASVVMYTAVAFASSVLANPVTVKLDARDPKTFRLYEAHYHQNICGPGACDGSQVIDDLYVDIHDDCNGGRCGGKRSVNIDDFGGSYCDADIEVCGRTLRLVKRGPPDCKPLRDLDASSNGKPYATIVEGGKDVGTCSVDFSRHYAKTCGIFAGGMEFQSHVYCAFF